MSAGRNNDNNVGYYDEDDEDEETRQIKQERRNIRSVKAFLVVFAVLCFLFFVIWAAFPVLNTLYVWRNTTGVPVNVQYRLSWWMVLLLGLNLSLPYMAFLVLLKPSSQARADVYFIFSVIMLVVNALLLVGFLLFWAVYTNTVFTGKEPWNDYRWCCVYQLDHPELCPNTPLFPCNPAVASTDLKVNGEFIWHWVAAGVFFILTIGHWAMHRLLRITGVVKAYRRRNWEGAVLGIFVITVTLGIFLYWASVPLLNTLYIHGYPRFAVPPSPNTFESTRYGGHWWMVWLLTWNIFPIFLFLAAMLAPRTFIVPWLHYWITVVVLLMSLIVAVVFGIVWLTNCNYSYSGRSLCKSYEWCCEFFASAPTLCGNTTPCMPEPALYINSEFLQHFIFAIIFCVLCGIQVWVNIRMKHYGVFYQSPR